MDLKRILGVNILRYRVREKLTQQQLASDAEISVSHLRNIEHGRGNATVDMIERISKSLKVMPEDLFQEHFEG